MLFRGISAVTMDAKGRMALPVRFREPLRERFGGALVATIDTAERCLLLYPQSAREEIQTQLEALPNVDPMTRRTSVCSLATPPISSWMVMVGSSFRPCFENMRSLRDALCSWGRDENRNLGRGAVGCAPGCLAGG